MLGETTPYQKQAQLLRQDDRVAVFNVVFKVPRLLVSDQTIHRSDSQISQLSARSTGRVTSAFSFASNATEVEMNSGEKKWDEFWEPQHVQQRTIQLVHKKVDAMLETCIIQKNIRRAVEERLRKGWMSKMYHRHLYRRTKAFNYHTTVWTRVDNRQDRSRYRLIVCILCVLLSKLWPAYYLYICNTVRDGQCISARIKS